MYNIQISDINGNPTCQFKDGDIIGDFSFDVGGISDTRFCFAVKTDKDLVGSIVKIFDCRCNKNVYCGYIEDSQICQPDGTLEYCGNSVLHNLLQKINLDQSGSSSDAGYIKDIFDFANANYGNIFNLDIDLNNSVAISDVQGENALELLQDILLRSQKDILIDGCNITYPYTPKNHIIVSKEGCYGETTKGLYNCVTFKGPNSSPVTVKDNDSINGNVALGIKPNGLSMYCEESNGNTDTLAEQAAGFLAANSRRKHNGRFCIYECTEANVNDTISVSGFCSEYSIREIKIARIRYERKKITIFADNFETIGEVIKRITR